MPPDSSNLFRGCAGLVLLLSLLPIIVSAGRSLRGTTLLLPWRWLVAAVFVWTAVFAATMLRPLEPGLADQLWYAAGILGLCPPIAVLGSRRPMSQVWSLFILIPLLLVFAWPACSDWSHRFQSSHWKLEEPMFVGFCLVLVMGLGNFLGTRLGLASLLWSAAQFLVVAPLGPVAKLGMAPDFRTRMWAVLLLIAGVWWGRLRCHLARSARSPLDNLWLSYREAFGLVWGKRLQDRFNFNARNAQTGFRLFRHGFALVDDREIPQPGELTPEQCEFAEYTLRWLLRRFVDPEWIDERLAAGSRSSTSKSDSTHPANPGAGESLAV
jgi:hypothetical protein